VIRTAAILDDAVRVLLDRVRADPAGPVQVGICAPGGYGKSTVLRQLAEVPGADPVRLVDDAHRLDETAVRELTGMARAGQPLVVAYRPWPRSAALDELVTALYRRGRILALAPFGPAQIQQLLTASGVRAGARLAERLATLTGGVPALVTRMAAALHGIAGDVDEVPEAAIAWLGQDLAALEPRVQLLLLADEAGVGLDTDLLGRLLGGDADLAGEVLQAARATGLLGRDGAPVPLVQRAIATLVPMERRIAVRRRLAELQLARGGSVLAAACSLLGTGAAGPVMAAAFEAAAGEALPREPALSARLYAAAAAAAGPAPAVVTRWARAAALAGDVDAALRLTDQVLATESADRPDAARVAAAALAHRGQLAHSAELYRWSGSATLATVGLIGTGRLAEVPPQAPEPPTLLARAASLMAHGVRESVAGDRTAALAALVQAADLLQPAGRTALLPDSPAALAALVALHTGEWAVAGSVLDRAASAGLGGGLLATRHVLLRAWMLLTRGHLAGVRELLAALDPPAEPRDRLFWVALELGLARREGDLAALRRTWVNAGQAVLRHPVDLFTLLPLGEFAICAARLGDHDRMAPHLAEADALLARLDAPALWTAPLRWSSLHAAIIAERPAAAADHAAALAATAGAGRYFRAMSVAAECWLQVLAGAVDAVRVDRAARGLHEAGLRWDGARLAAQAAARTTDRRAMVALLDCARTLQDRPAAARGPVAGADPAELSDRERQVAVLVVAGLTYKQIADRLFISPKTIEHHVARMRRRLGCENRADLLARLRHLSAA